MTGRTVAGHRPRVAPRTLTRERGPSDDGRSTVLHTSAQHRRSGGPATDTHVGSPAHGFPVSLCAALTRRIIETALEREMDQHLGYGKHNVAGRNHLNSRNGPRVKTILTDLGELRVACPRDRYGTFEPTVIRKRQLRVSGLAPLAIALLTPHTPSGQILAQFRAAFGDGLAASTVFDTISSVAREVGQVRDRPLDRVTYAVLSVGTWTLRPTAPQWADSRTLGAVGLTTSGHLEIVSLLRARSGADVDQWTMHLWSLRRRGLDAVDMVVSDDCPAQLVAIREVWPDATMRVAIPDPRIGPLPPGVPDTDTPRLQAAGVRAR